MAADLGDLHAMANYAAMLDTGDGIEMNKCEASRYYQMAALKNSEGLFDNVKLINKNDLLINEKCRCGNILNDNEMILALDGNEISI